MITTPNGIMLSTSEFDALPEYSCSLPTGTVIGKRWKRRVPYYHSGAPHKWYMGEYVASSVKDEIGIEWTEILLSAKVVEREEKEDGERQARADSNAQR